MDLAEYVGIPFRTLGRDREGCDCYGLVRLVYRERLGIELPAFTDYHETLSAETAALIAAERRLWREVAEPAPYDVLLFRVDGAPQHIGLVAQPGWMLHTTRGKHSCLERYTRPYWRARIDGFYRYHD